MSDKCYCGEKLPGPDIMVDWDRHELRSSFHCPCGRTWDLKFYRYVSRHVCNDCGADVKEHNWSAGGYDVTEHVCSGCGKEHYRSSREEFEEEGKW